KELYIWSRLSHENVLPLQGFALDKGFPIVISEWMANGTLREYLKKHPGCSVEDMILGITNGVDYLHKQNVVHSDLKADNVLINRDGHPVICDFGISRMVSATAAFAATTSGGFKGSVRWMARELILNGHHTRESDVWAFGMTAYVGCHTECLCA
ncbi:kinase-like protein, partial [Fomitiporia mediterranea MF3/22]|uniref:kinase-like protein n=1 Tax=Fomitiporia mediterranea (strain MF3/22) TaxID=694068 RepID=UPI0004408CC6